MILRCPTEVRAKIRRPVQWSVDQCRRPLVRRPVTNQPCNKDTSAVQMQMYYSYDDVMIALCMLPTCQQAWNSYGKSWVTVSAR